MRNRGGKPVIKNVLLADITADTDVQARVELSEETIADYGVAMLEQVADGGKVTFPPCVVFDDGTTLWLSDGFHRFHAATRSKISQLWCEVRKGSKARRNAVRVRSKCHPRAAPDQRRQASGRTAAARRRRVVTLE